MDKKAKKIVKPVAKAAVKKTVKKVLDSTTLDKKIKHKCCICNKWFRGNEINLIKGKGKCCDECNLEETNNIVDSNSLKENLVGYGGIIFIIFLLFKGCSGCFNFNKDFVNKEYIGKYCEEGYSNKCIEFFDNGTFKSNNFIYDIDYLGNNIYFGNGTWEYLGERSPQTSLFSDCYLTLDYDEVEIKSSREDVLYELDIAFKPGSSYIDGRARFYRVVWDPMTGSVLGCGKYVKVKPPSLIKKKNSSSSFTTF